MNFEPTKEQIHRAKYSYKRWAVNYFSGLHYNPYQWAVMCLQNEWSCGSSVNW